MREIKFRAFSPERNEMIYLSSGYGCIVSLETNGSHWGIFKENGRRGAYMNNNFGDIIMQYTGLHDKNGKKIYEGDIVKSDNECFFVVFEDGAFRIKSNKNTFYGTPLRQCIAKNMEAVGNIYENPELLEV